MPHHRANRQGHQVTPNDVELRYIRKRNHLYRDALTYIAKEFHLRLAGHLFIIILQRYVNYRHEKEIYLVGMHVEVNEGANASARWGDALRCTKNRRSCCRNDGKLLFDSAAWRYVRHRRIWGLLSSCHSGSVHHYLHGRPTLVHCGKEIKEDGRRRSKIRSESD